MGRGGGLIRRHRAGIATNLAVALAAGAVVVYAVRAEGFESHRAELNDGGIWVTSSVDGLYGRVNKPIDQADAAVFADVDDDLDVVQQDAAVVGVNRTENLLTPIDPATAQPPEGAEVSVAPGAQVALRGGTLAVLDPADGRVWATRVDTDAGVDVIGAVASSSDPIGTAGAEAALAVAEDGTAAALSATTDEVTLFATSATTGTGFARGEPRAVGADVTPGSTLTAVGSRFVVLDAETGTLRVLGTDVESAVEPGAVLQQPGPGADDVLLATTTELLAVDLATGETTSLAEAGGRPAAPVRLGPCRFGAWAGGLGQVVTACDGSEPASAGLSGEATEVVFRVNRGQLLLNDRPSGAVWNVDSDNPARIDDWEAFRSDVEQSEDQEREEDDRTGDRQPPRARPDDFGARRGRTTTLHPLDNDSAPAGRILAITAVADVAGDATVQIGPDGQTVQVSLPPDATGTTTFRYTVDDGRQEGSDTAAVVIRPRELPQNARPQLRRGYQPREWVVGSGGTIDVPVVSDWRDPKDGDPLSLVSAVAEGAEQSGARAQTTSTGRVRLEAPSQAGPVVVRYTVTDGIGEPVTESLRFRVQDRRDTDAVAAVAEPDIASGEVGEPITIRPLLNDLPGSDPVTPDATLALAGKVTSVGGADVRTNLAEGTVTFRSTSPRSFVLDYDASYGNAPLAPGRIRVDVRPRQRTPLDPVAMPDQAVLFGQSSTTTDVLANDIDPAGGMLSVLRATPQTDNQLDVAIVDGRWVRIAARQGTLVPAQQVVRYTIGNGVTGGVQGEIVVTQREQAEDDTPVTTVDRVSVRAGAGITVPALDNDFSPSGDTLALQPQLGDRPAGRLPVGLPGEPSAGAGQAFVAGRLVRYVAPASIEEAQVFEIRYVAVNESGRSAPGTVEVTVVPDDRPNQPPEPPTLEGRVAAGDIVRLRLPGVGVDPDGDPVTLLGIDSAPALGRIVGYGANSLEYQAFPGSGGTDEFGYRVVDAHGEESSGTARVAVVSSGVPQPPLAVADTAVVAPGAGLSVDVLGNDLVASGDRVRVVLDDPPAGVSLVGEAGPIAIEPGAHEAGRALEVVYRLTNGIDSSRATLTVRTRAEFNNPPVVPDAFGTSTDGDTVTVDVLESAYDPDGGRLWVTDVQVPPGEPPAEVDGARVTVTRGDQPRVVPFRVEDDEGGAATASLYVPARGNNLPYVPAGARIELRVGESLRARLADYVVNPAGGRVRLTGAQRVWSAPDDIVGVAAAGSSALSVQATQRTGPGAVVVEVTTDPRADDPAAVEEQVPVTAVLTIPVQVGATRPILRCPDEEIEIPQDGVRTIAVASYCHVWTADPADAAALAFDAEWQESAAGLEVASAGGEITVRASGATQQGARAVLAVTAQDSAPGRIRFVVTGGPPPSLLPIPVNDLEAGQSRVIDLARYLEPGVGDPEPTVLEASRISGTDVDIDILSATQVRVSAGPAAAGRAQFRIVMSDVPRARAEAGRRVEGRITFEVLGIPDTPRPPVPDASQTSGRVGLAITAPDDNGSPILRYDVRTDVGGVTQRCESTRCDVEGLTDGRTYRFQVRAVNAVGASQWSAYSRGATPDAAPGMVGPIRLKRAGDRVLVIAWTPPRTSGSKVDHYVVSWPGGSRRVTTPTAAIGGLDNNTKYVFTVYAVNRVDRGPARSSGPLQPQGEIGDPVTPSLGNEEPQGDVANLTIVWPVVPPNGANQVHYRLLMNGQPVPGCENTTENRCLIAGVPYNGARHEFRVAGFFEGEVPEFGPSYFFDAMGKPDAWGAWAVAPTGQNNQASATFTVPISRGAESTVSIVVNGSVVEQFDGSRATGQRSFTVPNNGVTYDVVLRVCNEFDLCSASAGKSLRTYGPLGPQHIVATSSSVANGTQIVWAVVVDGNGDPVSVRMSSQYRDVTVQSSGTGVEVVHFPAAEVGYSAVEQVTITLYDDDPARGPVAVTATSVATNPPPTPTVSIAKGTPCQDGTGTPCVGQGACTLPTCAQIQAAWANFAGSTRCVFQEQIGAFWSYVGEVTLESGGGARDTSVVGGVPGARLRFACDNGATSATLVWPG